MIMTAKDVINNPVFIKNDFDKLSSDLMEPITERLKVIMDIKIETIWEDASMSFYCPVCRSNGKGTDLIADSQHEKQVCRVCGKFEYQLSSKLIFKRLD